MASSVFLGFHSSLLFVVLFMASYTLAKPVNNAKSDPVSSIASKQCNNVYFYSAPNHEIKTIQEMKKQLIQLQDDINILKEKKRTVKGKISFLVLRLESCLFSKHLGRISTKP